jgi:hypothetical protein
LIHASPPLKVLGSADDVRITGLVPVGAVARLQIIEVDKEEGHRGGIADGGWPPLTLKDAPAEQAGQSVVKADGIKPSLPTG